MDNFAVPITLSMYIECTMMIRQCFRGSLLSWIGNTACLAETIPMDQWFTVAYVNIPEMFRELNINFEVL